MATKTGTIRLIQDGTNREIVLNITKEDCTIKLGKDPNSLNPMQGTITLECQGDSGIELYYENDSVDEVYLANSQTVETEMTELQNIITTSNTSQSDISKLTITKEGLTRIYNKEQEAVGNLTIALVITQERDVTIYNSIVLNIDESCVEDNNTVKAGYAQDNLNVNEGGTLDFNCNTDTYKLLYISIPSEERQDIEEIFIAKTSGIDDFKYNLTAIDGESSSQIFKVGIHSYFFTQRRDLSVYIKVVNSTTLKMYKFNFNVTGNCIAGLKYGFESGKYTMNEGDPIEYDCSTVEAKTLYVYVPEGFEGIENMFTASQTDSNLYKNSIRAIQTSGNTMFGSHEIVTFIEPYIFTKNKNMAIFIEKTDAAGGLLYDIPINAVGECKKPTNVNPWFGTNPFELNTLKNGILHLDCNDSFLQVFIWSKFPVNNVATLIVDDYSTNGVYMKQDMPVLHHSLVHNVYYVNIEKTDIDNYNNYHMIFTSQSDNDTNYSYDINLDFKVDCGRREYVVFKDGINEDLRETDFNCDTTDSKRISIHFRESIIDSSKSATLLYREVGGGAASKSLALQRHDSDTSIITLDKDLFDNKEDTFLQICYKDNTIYNSSHQPGKVSICRQLPINLTGNCNKPFHIEVEGNEYYPNDEIIYNCDFGSPDLQFCFDEPNNPVKRISMMTDRGVEVYVFSDHTITEGCFDITPSTIRESNPSDSLYIKFVLNDNTIYTFRLEGEYSDCR